MFNRNDKHAPRIDTLIGRSARMQGDVEFSGGPAYRWAGDRQRAGGARWRRLGLCQ